MQHHYEGHWKGWALKIETFLDPEMSPAKRVPFGPKKVVAPLKTIKYKRHKNNWYIVVLCTRVLLCNVVVCCCVLLCVRGVGEVSLQLLCEEVFRGWGEVGRPPPPTIV